MPDWTYRTVFRPLLFRLPFETARGLALGSMGRLARLPGGKYVIDLMGHMAPDERLQTNVGDLIVAAPLMLGCIVDPHVTALGALARFGFGLIEVGPVGKGAESTPHASSIDRAAETLVTSIDAPSLDLEALSARLTSAQVPRQAIVVRFAEPESDDAAAAIESFRHIVVELATYAGNFSLSLTMIADTEAVTRIISQLLPVLIEHNSQLLAVIDSDRGEATAIGLAHAAIDAGAAGIIIDVKQESAVGDQIRSPQCLETARKLTQSLRCKVGQQVSIIAGGGVHAPIDAVNLIADGATLVQVDSGVIFTGPGLPKRINDALLCQRVQSTGESEVTAEPGSKTRNGRSLGSPGASLSRHRPSRQAWLWTLLMGIAMLIGGVMAMVIAITHVVMPYDEQFVGMTRSELTAINDRLLLFMTHDRVTLAGTMLAVGTLYAVLSWFGIRRGWHWAHIAVIASAFIGFFTFFAFLGFGYFDPLHAFVTAVLFQFLLLGVHSETSRPAADDVPNLTNHAAWRRSLWGQLLYVIQGALLITAGTVICAYGMSTVFVPEDLEFMNTTAEALCMANPQIVPLVAHDRATFGGMLISCGITVLLGAMWGYRQGNAWLWWGLFVGGNVAYLAAILVHWSVGYTNLKHLLPAYGGLLLVWIGSAFSRQFLCSIDPSDQRLWNAALASDATFNRR